ncbi:MAG: hypothetical protein RL641_60 [Candidatus Parcubacteria bacterium]|jgi:hypothetical protein
MENKNDFDQYISKGNRPGGMEKFFGRIFTGMFIISFFRFIVETIIHLIAKDNLVFRASSTDALVIMIGIAYLALLLRRVSNFPTK